MQQALIDEPYNFPPNFAEGLPPELQRNIVQWLVTNYVFPYVMERRPYEKLWEKLALMYRVRFKLEDMRLTDDHKSLIERMIEIMANKSGDLSNVADTLIFDAIDRLKNLGHFIAWKDSTPVQFGFNKNYEANQESPFYKPISTKIKAANALIDWNNNKFEVPHRDAVARWHHYLYGNTFVNSEFKLRRDLETQSVVEFGTTFEPISIRNLWLDYRVNSWNFQFQPCPFFFEVMPRFATLQNRYDAQSNPFGFANLDSLLSETPQWLFSGDDATNAFQKVLQDRLAASGYGSGAVSIVNPALGQEAQWTLYPMLQYNERTGMIDPSVPPRRFIVNLFSSSIMQGHTALLRLQPSFYPDNMLPIYASAQMPDLDSGAYGLSIGEVLQSHYDEICTVTNQYIDNKNRVNAPPSWHVVGSPSRNQDVNRPNSKIDVNAPNEFGWAPVPDSTGTTVNMLIHLREQAQTSSKAVDAILGKAMGSRTSATEASNVFQTAMSGVTTDVNIYGQQILGGYAKRTYIYASTWGDKEILSKITGQPWVQLDAEDLFFMVELKTDSGSTFIESITKQNNLRYAIEAGSNSPAINQAKLWRALAKEMRMPELLDAIDDGDFEREVAKANEQAIQTYLGLPVIVDPMQNHEIAIRTKTQYLEDRDSIWNRLYAANPYQTTGLTTTQYLAQQIQIHQQFLMLIQQQQALAQQEAMQQQALLEQQSRQPAQPK